MWLKKQSAEIAREYCRKILIDRKDRKKIVHAPSQVELRSIMSPPITYYNELFGDYYELCKSLGFVVNYRNLKGKIDSVRTKAGGETIYVDTREQLPLKFNFPIEVKTLKFGDYSFSDREASGNCYVERKSLPDFIGTLSGGFDRFCKEVERAEADQSDLVVLVDEPLYDCLNFESLYRVSNKIKITPEFIFFNIRKIIQKYANIQFLFVDSRTECSRVMKKIFFSNKEYKKYDLQLMYDLKLL
jgi:hypothetical protein